MEAFFVSIINVQHHRNTSSYTMTSRTAQAKCNAFMLLPAISCSFFSLIIEYRIIAFSSSLISPSLQTLYYIGLAIIKYNAGIYQPC